MPKIVELFRSRAACRQSSKGVIFDTDCARPGAITLCALCILSSCATAAEPQQTVEIRQDVLEDKLRGGMLAQVIGNLNGLKHEFKYIDEPGDVQRYTPSLPDGAHTDDDTDIEWVYLREIARSRQNFLPSDRIAALWKRHINRRIFCANLYARGLMDLGLEPPWTGNVALNPWSDFNISGQFLCESFGLMAPAMPRTAARLGLNYTHVAIDGEPAQATQLFTTMISLAFVETDLDKLLDAGLVAIDPKSEITSVVADVRRLHREHPSDWRAARLAIKNRWQTHGGEMRDRNGYELNTASTIAALAYGQNDFVETLRIAFNFGWDADNNAATAATIVGVIHGRRWMDEQGWNIKDVYRNTTRDAMPNDETLSSLEDALIAAARVTIEANGGRVPAHRETEPGEDSVPANDLYIITAEIPANVEPLTTADVQLARAKQRFGPRLTEDLLDPKTRVRAVYVAICLGESERLKQVDPEAWSGAIADLQTQYPLVVRNLFRSPSDQFRTAAKQAGLNSPEKERD